MVKSDVAAILQQMAVLQAQLAQAIAPQRDDAFAVEALSDNEIVAIFDGALSKGLTMRPVKSVFGPYEHGAKWRIKVTYVGCGFTWLAYPTELEARRARRGLRLKVEQENGMSVAEALEVYRRHLATKGPTSLKSESITTKLIRIRAFFAEAIEEKLSFFADARAAALLAALTKKKSRQGKDRTMAYDTIKGTISAVRDFMKWAHEQGHGARKDVCAGLKPAGQAAPRKSSLRVDDARRWVARAKVLADAGDEQAIAAWTAFDTGLRSGEVTGRLVRDLDNNGTMLFIDEAKTTNSEGLVEVGEEIQPYLRQLAAGRAPDEFLFPSLATLRDPNGWLLRATTSIAASAGVPRVTPHGLRRTAATLVARTRGMKAASLLAGHADTGVTTRHYVAPAVGQAERNDRLREILST